MKPFAIFTLIIALLVPASARAQVYTYAHITVISFLDDNANGLWDEDEEAAAGARMDCGRFVGTFDADDEGMIDTDITVRGGFVSCTSSYGFYSAGLLEFDIEDDDYLFVVLPLQEDESPIIAANREPRRLFPMAFNQ